jgi:hypothetical protein
MLVVSVFTVTVPVPILHGVLVFLVYRYYYYFSASVENYNCVSTVR